MVLEALETDKEILLRYSVLKFIRQNLLLKVWIIPLSQIVEWPSLFRLRPLHETSFHQALVHILGGITGSV